MLSNVPSSLAAGACGLAAAALYTTDFLPFQKMAVVPAPLVAVCR